MKKRKQPSQKLTIRYGSHRLGKILTVGMLGGLTLGTAIMVSLIGSLAEPDFWHPIQLVDRIGKLLMFSAINLVFLAQIGYSWHLFLAAVDAAVQFMQQTGNFLLIILTAVFIELRLAIVQYLPGKRIPEAALKNHVHAILTAIQQRLIAQRPKTKAPLFLFQQAPLLIAP